MKLNTVYIVPKGTFGDKNTNIQFKGKPELADQIRTIVIGICQYGENRKFKDLNLFIQGDSKEYDGKNSWWIMIEAWSNNQDLFFDFCEFISTELNVELEIGLPLK